jgi:hypothetical protein
MSGLPIFADPSTAVVYHAVPSASASGSSQDFVAGGHSQPPPPSTMAMMVAQNIPQKQQDSSTSMPLPPGMEVVLGDKKYTIQYQSYEMTREKATEYIAKCTGTPYSRMSSPPDPEAISHPPNVAGGSRAEGRGGFGGTATAMPTAADGFQRVTPIAMAAITAGDRETVRTSTPPPTTTSEEKDQRKKSPDDFYTIMAPSASGLLPPTITRGALLQQQHPLSMVPEQQQVVTTEGSTYLAQTYVPSPPPRGAEQQEQQNLGYFWEDGCWKVWQANSSNDIAVGAVGDTTADKIPPPVPVQQNQYSQHSQSPYPSQHQTERPQYQYQYQYHYPQQQQQQQPSVVTTSAVHEPSPDALPHSQQPQHYPPQPPQMLPRYML